MYVKRPKLFTEQYFKRYNGYDDFLKGGISTRHRRALEFLKPEPGEKILDIGCGRGEIVWGCNRIDCYAVGIDISKASSLISKNFGIVLLADVSHLPFCDNIFDGITFLEVIEHLNTQECYNCIWEIYRILKKGGRIVIETPIHKPSPINFLLNIYAKLKYRNLAFVESKTIKFIQKLLKVKFQMVTITDKIPIKLLTRAHSLRSISQLKFMIYMPFTRRFWIIGSKK